MTHSDSLRAIAALRAKARRLLRQLESPDAAEADAAWARFRRLRSFSDCMDRPAADQRGRIRLKHALAVIAEESGDESWLELKSRMESQSRDRELWYAPGMDAYLNRWFAHYEEAKHSRELEGGFLLPYRNHFFVCESDAIRLLGLDPEDPDWTRIQWDGARPEDRAAFTRLLRRRQENVPRR